MGSLAEVVRDGECLLVVSGDAAFTSAVEVTAYRHFSEEVRAHWPKSLMTFHSAPTADLPVELEALADALVFQSGHHGEAPNRARELAARYRSVAGPRPVMNAEPSIRGTPRWWRRWTFRAGHCPSPNLGERCRWGVGGRHVRRPRASGAGTGGTNGSRAIIFQGPNGLAAGAAAAWVR